jgi:hypothetical protein
MSTGFGPRRPAIGGVNLSSSTFSPGGGPTLPALPFINSFSLPPPPPRGVSTADMIQHKGFPGMSKIKNPNGMGFMTNQEAQSRAPAGGYQINLAGSTGFDDGGRRIGSAAGAVGSPGMPTSVRGRLEKFGPFAAAMPTWQAARVGGAGLFGGGLKDLYNMNRPSMPPPPSGQQNTLLPPAEPPPTATVVPPLNTGTVTSAIAPQAGMVASPIAPTMGNLSGQSSMFNIPGMPSNQINLLSLLNQIRP